MGRRKKPPTVMVRIPIELKAGIDALQKDSESFTETLERLYRIHLKKRPEMKKKVGVLLAENDELQEQLRAHWAAEDAPEEEKKPKKGSRKEGRKKVKRKKKLKKVKRMKEPAVEEPKKKWDDLTVDERRVEMAKGNFG